MQENQIKIAGLQMDKSIADMLTNFDLDSLDMYEEMVYEDFCHNGKEYALQLLINQVEGSHSQLSEGLAEIAELQNPTQY